MSQLEFLALFRARATSDLFNLHSCKQPLPAQTLPVGWSFDCVLLFQEWRKPCPPRPRTVMYRWVFRIAVLMSTAVCSSPCRAQNPPDNPFDGAVTLNFI